MCVCFGVVVSISFMCVRDVRECVLEIRRPQKKLEFVESVNFDSNFFDAGLYQKELKICYS